MVLSSPWRKVLHDLWESKTRTLLVVLSISIGVFAVGMIAGCQALLNRSVAVNWKDEHPASAIIWTDPFDEDLIDVVRGMPGVSAVEGRRVMDVRVRQADQPNAEWSNLILFAVADYATVSLSRPVPQEGVWPPTDKTVVLERSSLPWLDVQIGGNLVLDTGSGSERSLAIAGSARAFHLPPSMLAGSAQGFVTLDTLEWLGAPSDFNALTFCVSENTSDKEHIQAIADQIVDKIENSGRIVSRIEISGDKYFLQDIINTFLLILGVLGLFSLFLSGFLTVNTITALLTQQVRQIGVMKALGARPMQITGMYLSLVLCFGVLALILAVPLGAVVSAGLIRFAGGYLNFDVAGYTTAAWVLAMEVCAGLLVPVISALFPIMQGAGMTIREAISSYGLSTGHRHRHSGAPAGDSPDLSIMQRLTAWLPRPMWLSLRNTFRQRKRLALTLTTLVLAGATFMAVFSVRHSLLVTLDRMTQYWQYDVEITLSEPQRIEKLLDEAVAVPGVAQTEAWFIGSGFRKRPDGTQTATNITLIGIPAGSSLIQPTLVEGRWLLPEDENALVLNQDALFEEPDLQLGSELIMDVNGKELTWKVIGIVTGQLFGPQAYASADYLSENVGAAGRANRLVVVSASHDSAAHSATLQALETHLTDAGLRLQSSTTLSDMREQRASQFNLIIIFLLIMALLLAGVGGLGLMGTMSLSVLERSREIGVLRAIGASNGAVMQIVMVEGVLIGLLSWAVASILAFPAGRLLSDAVGVEFLQTPLLYQFSGWGTLAWFATVSLVSALASYLPARRAVALTVRDVLSFS